MQLAALEAARAAMPPPPVMVSTPVQAVVYMIDDGNDAPLRVYSQRDVGVGTVMAEYVNHGTDPDVVETANHAVETEVVETENTGTDPVIVNVADKCSGTTWVVPSRQRCLRR